MTAAIPTWAAAYADKEIIINGVRELGGTGTVGMSYANVKSQAMFQFYFLSIVSNFLAGLSLASDWIAQKIPGLSSLPAALSGRTAKLIGGLSSLLVGFATLFVPVEGPLIIGDLFPSVMGMTMGIALLFEVFRQEAVLPAERSDRQERLPVGYRTTLGMLGIAAAILHFFLPERPFL